MVTEFGGKPSTWTKKRSPAIDIDGELYELGWYEHH